MQYIYRIFTLIILVSVTSNGYAQVTAQTSFGKNRVQYNRQLEDWLYYESEHFITYWYGDARNVAQAAMQTGEYDYASVQQLLEHQITGKFEMLVFSDLTDVKQSNIGSEELFQMEAGETKVIGNKMFVYFDGNHQHLREQVREGMAGLLLNSMLFGTNFKEIVQNAVMLNLPVWYTDGLLSYCGDPWSTETDELMRDLVLSGDYEAFDELAKVHPRLAGHAFWHYISLHFGRSTISNLLYLTRINRSIDAGFLYVLGGGYERTTEAMMSYFEKRYRNEEGSMVEPDEQTRIRIKNKRKYKLTQLSISPDGQRIAWARNDIGRWKVYVQDLRTGKRERVLRGGMRNKQQTTDYAYPLLSWNPDNKRLAILYEKRDVARIAILEPGKKGSKEDDILAPGYQRVYSMDYMTPNDLVFSAEVRGFSDLFMYNTVNRQTERLTNDYWDDLDPVIVRLEGKRGILFSSNRINDTLTQSPRIDSLLPLGRLDLFYYNLEDRSNELVRITNTPLADERSPAAIDSNLFVYTTDESGVFNRHLGYMEPYIAYYHDLIYLNDGAIVKALNVEQQGEWPEERTLAFLAPTDSVLVNIDSSMVDSIVTEAVYKKKPVTWNRSNYSSSIQHLHTAPKVQKEVLHLRTKGEDRFYLMPLDTGRAAKPARYTRFRELQFRQLGVPIPIFTEKDLEESKNAIPQTPLRDTTSGFTIRNAADTLQPGWLFRVPDRFREPAPPRPEYQSPPATPRTDPSGETEVARERQDKNEGEPGRYVANTRFNTARIVPYRLKFRNDYITTTIDNNLLFEGLDSYTASPGGFITPPPGILIKANFKDLMEDYVLEAGFRLPTTFNGAEYYLFLDDRKKRWDKRYALYRKTVVNSLDDTGGPFREPDQVRTNTLLGQFELRYPINPFLSFRGRATLRQDKAITLSTNRPTLETPDYAEQRAGIRLSAVYDNTIDVELNIKNGTRALVFTEAIKRFEFNTEPNWSLDFNDGYMTVIGLDARHYQRLDRRSILALRLAGATSFGSEKILYYLGGIDNWLFPRFNENIPTPAMDEDFAFQTLAANLRGFEQNIRNGNSFALFNAELRVPIFKYFSKQPVMGNFWRNFQIIGFFDAGTAWQGNDPFSGDNPLNTVVVENPPTVSVTVNYFRDPVVAGYGLGIRSVLFGIHVRADYAWGIETRVVQDPVFYLGIGTDF